MFVFAIFIFCLFLSFFIVCFLFKKTSFNKDSKQGCVFDILKGRRWHMPQDACLDDLTKIHSEFSASLKTVQDAFDEVVALSEGKIDRWG